MGISAHVERFHGLPVTDVRTAVERGGALPAAAATAWKIGLDHDDARDFGELWEWFLETVDPAGITAVVIGDWTPGSLAEPLRAVLDAAGRLPRLTGLFLGDITYDECEISWLRTCDVTGVFTAFPQLEELVVRGAAQEWEGEEGLSLAPLRHERLRSLRLESGGLPADVLRSVAACDFPALEGLELWLGVDDYGGDWTMDDLQPFLAGTRFPALRRLSLQNSVHQDEIAALAARAPVVARLSHLGLGMGTLTDEGAAALLEGQPLTHLASLDLHHHYLTEDVQQRLRAALPGVAIDLSHARRPGDPGRYVTVAE